jgi:hypothetical protein
VLVRVRGVVSADLQPAWRTYRGDRGERRHREHREGRRRDEGDAERAHHRELRHRHVEAERALRVLELRQRLLDDVLDARSVLEVEEVGRQRRRGRRRRGRRVAAGRRGRERRRRRRRLLLESLQRVDAQVQLGVEGLERVGGEGGGVGRAEGRGGLRGGAAEGGHRAGEGGEGGDGEGGQVEVEQVGHLQHVERRVQLVQGVDLHGHVVKVGQRRDERRGGEGGGKAVPHVGQVEVVQRLGQVEVVERLVHLERVERRHRRQRVHERHGVWHQIEEPVDLRRQTQGIERLLERKVAQARQPAHREGGGAKGGAKGRERRERRELRQVAEVERRLERVGKRVDLARVWVRVRRRVGPAECRVGAGVRQGGRVGVALGWFDGGRVGPPRPRAPAAN